MACQEKPGFSSIHDRAATGDPHFQYLLGEAYLKGEGVNPNSTLAAENFFKSATQGNEQAFGELQKTAEKGEAETVYLLGRLYASGIGPKGNHQDYTKAAECYRQAARLGHTKAHNDLGTIFVKGYGVGQNDAEAFQWFKKAAALGDPLGQYNLAWSYALGRGTALNFSEALRWFMTSADGGLAVAQLRLGQMYLNGEGGVKKDYAVSAKWLKLAAQQGNAAAQNSLAVLYENSLGVPKDPYEAVNLFRRAAEQGEPRGQANLARMYENGLGGLKRDINQALFWYILSSEQGEAIGLRGLDTLVQEGLVTHKQLEEGRRMAWKYQKEHGMKQSAKK